LLNWAARFGNFCFLDNSGYAMAQQQYECLLAAGVKQSVQAGENTWQDVNALIAKKGWVFGHLSYEAAHHLYGLTPKKDEVGFPLFYFFQPQMVISLKGDQLSIKGENVERVFQEIEATAITAAKCFNSLLMEPRLQKEAYIQTIQQLQAHIQRGDCYEINFCQEFFAEGATINPVDVYRQLVQLSPNPYSAFYRVHDQYLICASPERFLARKGRRLLSQPIKGTAQRSWDKVIDEQLKNELLQSQKERSENVMIVDLVRNDLSRICKEGSVQVDELFGIYPFPQVHQMISTISGEIEEGMTFSQIMEATFPMGSMTGAPKRRVMELIHQYEPVSRGIFSGAVGYIAPGGDFDFNVVIRSIMYNAATAYLSYQTGSGITFYADAEREWEECLLKGEAIKKVLTG
jgi:para-aminobenzoate synthetase component 1